MKTLTASPIGAGHTVYVKGGAKRGREDNSLLLNNAKESKAMKERDQSRLSSVFTLLLGIWVAISPIWLTMHGGAVATAIATGSIIGVFSIIQYFWANTFPSWIIGLAAVWMFISSFFYGTSGGAMLSFILSSIATFVLALWDGAEVSQTSNQHHMATG